MQTKPFHLPKPVYENLLALVKDKDYFVITTNVDHCFQKAGFDKKRLFCPQEIEKQAIFINRDIGEALIEV